MRLHDFRAIALVASLLVVALAWTPAHRAAPPAPYAAATPAFPGASAEVTAFVDVAVIPMDKARVLRGQTVVVQQGRITALGPVSKVRVPAGAIRIDGRGKYLIPGLGDMHAHLAPMRFGGARDDAGDSLTFDQRLFLFAANGVTTIRNLDYYPDGGLSLRFKARAAAGALWSPRIYTAGNWMTKESPNPADFANELAAYKAAGYDLVKVNYGNRAVAESIAAIAPRVGLPIAGHVPDGTDLAWALSKRYSSFEHLFVYLPHLAAGRPGPKWSANAGNWDKPWDGVRMDGAVDSAHLAVLRQQLDLDKIPAAAAATKRAGVWNTPTQALAEHKARDTAAVRRLVAEWPEIRYLAPELRRFSDGMILEPVTAIDGTLEARRRMIKALQDSGAGLLLGSDAPAAFLVPGFSAYRELAALVRAGLTPYQALLTGTRNVAEFFKTLDETGTVAVGKRADLVLLTGNPLEDVRKVADPVGVMIGGRWLSRSYIDQRLATLIGKVS